MLRDSSSEFATNYIKNNAKNYIFIQQSSYNANTTVLTTH
jgi:hypothetical protein